MFAIAFDLDYLTTAANHPKSVRQAYRDLERALSPFGFRRVQQSVFIAEEDDLAAVTYAMTALKALPWFSTCVKDIRAFRVENWSNFNAFFKGPNL
jgi:virulence-associated protein VapD